ncbi:hypothetical protein IIC38_14505 [candidate division KSB1 bacterium]|nr:hypothetical protein [candidate division KSB1 bacterium]
MASKTSNDKTKKSDVLSSNQFVYFLLNLLNETDRAAVIVGAANLDLILYKILTKFLLRSHRQNEANAINFTPTKTGHQTGHMGIINKTQ